MHKTTYTKYHLGSLCESIYTVEISMSYKTAQPSLCFRLLNIYQSTTIRSPPSQPLYYTASPICVLKYYSH